MRSLRQYRQQPALCERGRGADYDLRGTAQLALNTWTHLAATYSGSVLNLYVNGTQVASQPATGQIVSSTGALKFGGNAIWSEWFNGLIDEVRVYNRALSAAEIQADMNAPITSSDATPPSAPGTLTAVGTLTSAQLNWGPRPTTSALPDTTSIAGRAPVSRRR